MTVDNSYRYNQSLFLKECAKLIHILMERSQFLSSPKINLLLTLVSQWIFLCGRYISQSVQDIKDYCLEIACQAFNEEAIIPLLRTPI